MAIYKNDLVDINLESGSIHRSFRSQRIGEGDSMANRFGVRLFRNGEPVNAEASTCEGIFMAPNGVNILISGNTYTGTSENTAWVQLPQACYSVEGNFTLAIKLIGSDVTGTMRIIDGVVDNTGIENPVDPGDPVPTYQEILAVYEEMVEAKEGCIRYDITQELTEQQMEKARQNIDLGQRTTLARGTDFDDVKRGVYGILSQQAQNPYLHVPDSFKNGYSGMLYVEYSDDRYPVQFLVYSASGVSTQQQIAYRRSIDSGDTWSEWSTGIFYNSVSRPADLNDITEPNVYSLLEQRYVVDDQYLNMPDGFVGASLLFVNDVFNGVIEQMLFSFSFGFASRMRIGGTWTAWSGYERRTTLAKLTDLNDINIRGTYSLYTMQDATTYGHAPEGMLYKTGLLVVDAGDMAYPFQYIIAKDSGEIFVRQSIDGGTTWSVWRSQDDQTEEMFRKKNLVGIFHTIGVIGDSLASGQGRVNDYSHYHDFYEYSWPQCMKRILGNEVYNFTKSGLSTRTWLTDPMGYPLMSDGNHKAQCYIIGLGANDIDLGLEYLGSPSDIKPDYTQNPDTYYGNYARIISLAKAIEPRAVIFVITNPAYGSSTLRNQFNEAVRYMATAFDNVYLIDPEVDLYNKAAGFIRENLVAGHYTPAAYLYMAEYLINSMSNVIYKQPEDFFFVNLIGTEYDTPTT